MKGKPRRKRGETRKHYKDRYDEWCETATKNKMEDDKIEADEQEAMATTHRVLVEKKSCQTCELWVKTPSIARQGQCYRYPVSQVSMDTHWCAEWRKK